MPTKLEHANITVRNIDETVRFLTTAFPEFRVRGSGVVDGARWLHVGTVDTYMALNELRPDSSRDIESPKGPLNHFGYVVDNAEAVANRLREAGYEEGLIAPAHPYRIRKYFDDGDGIEWEFVEYLTDDPAKQNDYDSD